MTEEVERFIEEQEEKKRLAFKSFTQIIQEQTKIHEVEVPELGCVIRYGKLSLADWMEVKDVEDLEEAQRLTLARMWRKGDLTVDLEKINDLPFDVVQVIRNRMMEHTPFLHLRWLKPSQPARSSEPSTPSSQPTPDTPSGASET